MTKQIPEVVDPRLPTGPVISLTDRLETLSGMIVLLLDNGKGREEFGHFDVAFDLLNLKLQEAGVVSVPRRTIDLLRCSESQIAALAEELAPLADAVVLGIADTGVSAPTVMLAAGLEDRGVPTTVICQGIGISVARSMVEHLVPGLPLPKLSTWRMSSREEVANATEQLWDEVSMSLTRGRVDNDYAKTHTQDIYSPLRLSGMDLDGEFTGIMDREEYGDGLPLRSPSRDRVDDMLAAMQVYADEQIWPPVPPRSVPVLGQDVAAVAVMAGCSPQVGRVVVEAFRAMAQPEFRLFQASITTHPAGTLVLVSGPASSGAGMAHGHGSMGPGNKSSATIGRSIALSYRILLGARPGLGDLSLQGSPAEYSFCVAENLGDSPWPGLHVDFGQPDASTVTVLKCEGPHNVLDNTSKTARSLLTSVADTASSLGGNNLYNPSAQTVVFLNPEHANIIAADGWGKRDVQMYLFEKARRRRGDLLGRGIVSEWSPWVGDLVPIVEDPRDIIVVVTGAPGPQSQVAIPWGYSRGVTRPLPSP